MPHSCRYVPGNNRERTSYSLFKSSRYLPLLVTFPTSSGVAADCDRSCTKVSEPQGSTMTSRNHAALNGLVVIPGDVLAEAGKRLEILHGSMRVAPVGRNDRDHPPRGRVTS